MVFELGAPSPSRYLGTVDDLPGTPNCPQCLVPLELVGSVKRPRWECPECE